MRCAQLNPRPFSGNNMLSKDERGRLAELTDTINRLESLIVKAQVEALALIEPHLTSIENCKEIIDLVPCGYLGYKVRTAAYGLDPGAEL
jgi:hypothetical protein